MYRAIGSVVDSSLSVNEVVEEDILVSHQNGTLPE